MGEKKEIKLRLSTVIFLFIIIVLVVALGVVYYLGFVKNDDADNNVIKVEDEKIDNDEIVTENEKKIKKINETKEIVYTIEKKESIEGENTVVTNKIPVINLNYDIIKNINTEIEENYTKRPTHLQLYDYKYYINDNILSIVIEKASCYVEGAEEYDVYNVDIYKGTVLDEKSLLFELGKDGADLIEEVKNIVKKVSYSYNVSFDKEFVQEQYDRTISGIVKDKNIQYFLDDEGTLNFIIRKYNVAGGESTYTIYKFDNKELGEDKKQEIINILKNSDNSTIYFKVLKINYENEKYNVEVEYNAPVVISENEFSNLKKDKEITLNNEKYEYVTDNDSANGYIQKNNKKYEVINYNNGYAFELTGTAGGYTWTINKTENMKFVADEDTVIYDSFAGQEYKLKDNEAKDWLNKSLENTIVRLNYTEDLGLSIFIDNK